MPSRQPKPYGPLVTSSCRVATWNVWGRFGDWQARQKGLISQVSSISPDILCLQESWETNSVRQTDLVGEALELPHRYSTADWPWDGWCSGATVLSRWPIIRHYILSAWPRRGGVGHPLDCRLLGETPADGVQISDHHGVYADLRY